MENTTSDQDDALLTVPEIATELRLHQTTVGRMCRAGELQGALRVGVGRGRWRVPASRVKAYKESRTAIAA